MGISLLGLLGSQVLVRDYHQSCVKIQSFTVREKFSISYKPPKFKLCIGNISVCKSEFIDMDERTSPNEVRKEIENCYELIHRLGRGVVYLGSSRMGPNHSHYSHALELSREIASLLDCTSWSGVGPGLMDAVTMGAMQVGKPVGGFKIAKEAGEWTASKFHPYLPSENYLTCRFFSARKHGLVDAAVRSSCSDKTAVVALPGGIGTLDELFEILALIQLERIGSSLPVPFLVMNYDSFYAKLLDFLGDCEDWGTVSKGEVESLWKVCNTNAEALDYLSDFYNLRAVDRGRNEKEVRTSHKTIS
ncbi:cytokinin riboside 5'-monophosphate phosphoribohydrolase LOGL10 isoform X1 [Tripterygium wilfordii]|uniref:Cytokinin riboside 5'-monophosphate phosphoribohydrolase LOGL10 isoform X1 n=1 Tax=Tripterygium wilfordii TaxID=458696 RepID=A0A7J7C185_TRIWF|nr:probable cytokinin riboside 5'-monophosphate phosphoribohydrolase LOGL10 [Tripterygium wilfordii]KAF5727919.1 cytokinin riboside 5'-monophosphate phosphoribohydrolase LOGL10 isoform X1 [Tripterygium wilfordii]